MIKKLIASVLSTTLLFSSVSALAAGFSDLNEFHLWAEDAIEDMTRVGIIKGYTDGTFRPDQAITKTEALVLVSRAAGFISEDYETFKTMARERFATVVDPYNCLYPSEVSYLLYKGVIKEDDLAGFVSANRANSPLLRYEMAELLTHLMRAEDSLSSHDEINLTYADAGEIPYESIPYVDYVSNAAIMQGVYDPEHPDDIFFKPNASVTRAQMAVLLHRVLDKTNIDVDYSTIVGKNPSARTITHRDSANKTTIFRVREDINLYIDGYKTEDLSHAATGASIAFFYMDKTLVDIEIVNNPMNRWDGVESEIENIPSDPVDGIITTIVLSEECSVTVDDVSYPLSAAATIYVNHVAGTVYDLRVGHTAELQFSNGKVIMLYASSAQNSDETLLTAEGIITKLNLTNRSLYLEIENASTGETSERILYIETGAAIFNAISGQTIDFLSLEVDDTITATGVLRDGSFYASKIIVK